MKQFVVDAFTDTVLSGNPAAVCVMERWLPDETMLAIARENNLSETAFAVHEENGYHLRWFTPGGEIDLCGHATLATAFVVLRYYRPEASSVSFITTSGALTVAKRGDLYEMDFPTYELVPIPVTGQMEEALGARPKRAYLARDLLCIFDDENTVRHMEPDMAKACELDGLGVHVTARGRDYDCVSRSFVPKLGVPEDPVCGSGHCHIMPYWAHELNKDDLVGYQASARGGVLYGQVSGDRLLLSGKAALFSEAEIHV